MSIECEIETCPQCEIGQCNLSKDLKGDNYREPLKCSHRIWKLKMQKDNDKAAMV